MLDRLAIARRRILASTIGTLTLLALTGCSVKKSSPTPRAAVTQALVGAWRSKLQFSSGAFAPIQDLEFLYVFNAGGTMTESSNHDGAPPVPPAYGVWREVTPNQFEAKYLFYTTKAPSRFEEVAGGGGWLPSGHGEITERIQLSGDGQSFESTIIYEALDPSGKPVAGGGEARGHAIRIAL